MKLRSKRYKKEAVKIDANKKYDLDEAVKFVKSFGSTKFDQTVNIAMQLNIDAKKSEQNIRGSCALPHGIGKSKKVIVFADGDEAKAAMECGADEVGLEDLCKKILDGWDDFDVAVAVQRSMKFASKLGKVLGPKGKMPSPKNGTIIKDGEISDLKTVVKEFKAGRIEFRNDASGNLHAPVGKISFPPEKLKENVVSFVEHIKSVRPANIKGFYVLSCTLSPTMGPGVKVDIAPF